MARTPTPFNDEFAAAIKNSGINLLALAEAEKMRRASEPNGNQMPSDQPLPIDEQQIPPAKPDDDDDDADAEEPSSDEQPKENLSDAPQESST